MRCSLSKFALLTLLLPICAATSSSQIGRTDRNTNVDIEIRVIFSNDHPAGNQILVQLIDEMGTPRAQTYTDTNGRVSFHVTAPGNYEVRASGPSVEGTASEQIRIEDLDKSRTLFVHVRPKTSGSATTEKAPGGPVTSAAELRVPSEAKKAFHKGMQAWEQNDYAKAAEYFEKAVAIYPEYDSAYNNLGVMYFRLNQVDKAQAAFEKSVALNDRNADADRNLARILLHDGNYAKAEELLKKSLIVEPLNPVTLTLLCVAQAQSGEIDAAIATARRTHQLPHEGYSLVHLVAGQALEQKGLQQEAYTEYQTYLQESPTGPEAQQVRNALARLTAANNPTQH